MCSACSNRTIHIQKGTQNPMTSDNAKMLPLRPQHSTKKYHFCRFQYFTGARQRPACPTNYSNKDVRANFAMMLMACTRHNGRLYIYIYGCVHTITGSVNQSRQRRFSTSRAFGPITWPWQATTSGLFPVAFPLFLKSDRLSGSRKSFPMFDYISLSVPNYVRTASYKFRLPLCR